jgi:hypothetical protein
MFIKSIGIGFVGVMLFVASAAAANSVLEGVVKDARGHPVQGVDVELKRRMAAGCLRPLKQMRTVVTFSKVSRRALTE